MWHNNIPKEYRVNEKKKNNKLELTKVFNVINPPTQLKIYL